ncbi:hypothetical protein GCG54_00006945 [Colletotrichum gloeosporioides]|uniref:Uncharacterized protein n=1 Tax=Colletotrichum gloeosporioides TaxID=474922 RepID=A0A8H4FPE2_COLGL|nr:uncharacterized protein GCG54_00006945 [Colletotrichum gloeosporioides]KAF3808324.1 hypothetical protein GCG54_00006945 [Colletotrichum gloeosporioides]
MTMEEFLNLSFPRKDQFIRAVERAGAQSGMQTGNDRLSLRMRESWICWEKLHREGMGDAMLDQATVKEKDRFVNMKMDQFKQYLRERQTDARFSDDKKDSVGLKMPYLKLSVQLVCRIKIKHEFGSAALLLLKVQDILSCVSFFLNWTIDIFFE